jgi:hypothetical protein
MLTPLGRHFRQDKEVGALCRQQAWAKVLVLVGLGTMVLMVLALLSGCGSDRAPGGSAKGKNAKTASRPGAIKPQVVTPVLMDQEGTVPGARGKVKKQPASKGVILFPAVNRAEFEAKAAADRKKYERPDNEVLPGMTLEKLQAVAAADRKKYERPENKVLPRATRGDLEARAAADAAKYYARGNEILPGITREELEARRAAEPKPAPGDMMETFPANKK